MCSKTVLMVMSFLLLPATEAFHCSNLISQSKATMAYRHMCSKAVLMVMTFLLLPATKAFHCSNLISHSRTWRTSGLSDMVNGEKTDSVLTQSTSSDAADEQAHSNRDQKDADTQRPIFDLVASRAALCLYESEMRRDAKTQGATTQATSLEWINEAASFALEKTIDRVKVRLPEERTGVDRDEASAWMRWMKATPTPMIVDLSPAMRAVANTTISDASLELIDFSREEFLSRLGCRLVLLPSGASLSAPLVEPPSSMIYGKLLFGGITRYRRLLSSSSSRRPPRRAGERTAYKISPNDNVPCWVNYGGTERMYEAVDIGSAAVLECIILPKSVIARGATLTNLVSTSNVGEDMVIQNLNWKPQHMFDMVLDDANAETNSSADPLDHVSGYTPISQSGKDRNDAFESDFKSNVGGLSKQIEAIVRRVLDGRVIRPAQEDVSDETTMALSTAAMEADELAILGLTPVRGLLLFGPPGTGKTLLARQIAKALRARTPKIVSAPELLDRWVGGSEKLVRELFADAEAELAVCNGDATKSALHVIVIDEIDAVFRRRSSGEDSGEATRASVVNQILAKMDGMEAINNLLLIGLTNRRELLDEALLRPGRLEVQIEVPLPDQGGRREILQIHFGLLRQNGRLSKPLCCAIDGISHQSVEDANDVSLEENPEGKSALRSRKRDKLKRLWNEATSVVRPVYDLASDAVTGGYSGADLAGLVRSAGSHALSRARKSGNSVDNMLITLEDVKMALEEVKP